MIKQVQLPTSSFLHQEQYDYYDCFQSIFKDKGGKITTTDLGKAFFSTSPQWIVQLFRLRNQIVRFFGLKTSDNFQKKSMTEYSFSPQERIGLFRVFRKTENEIIFGEDDKHLNFKVSLLQEVSLSNAEIRQLTCSTIVKYNNGWGRLYFFFIKPFHKLIVPSIIKSIISHIEQQ